ATRQAAAKGSSLMSRSVRTHAQLSGIRVRTRRVRVLEMGGGESIKFDVFFDYQCPFVYRAAGLIDAVRRSGDRNLEVRWRYFSLTQVNSKDDGWTVWGAPASELVRGRLAFQAAEAARRQGRFDEMHGALLQARHRGGRAAHPRDQASLQALTQRLGCFRGTRSFLSEWSNRQCRKPKTTTRPSPSMRTGAPG